LTSFIIILEVVTSSGCLNRLQRRNPQVENLLKHTSYFHGDMSMMQVVSRIFRSLNLMQHIPQVVIKVPPEKQYSLDEFDFLPNVERSLSEENPVSQRMGKGL
jgi:hypothetical protein